MRRRIASVAAGLALAAVPLAGCSQAEEAARGAAESVATEAASKAAEAAEGVATRAASKAAEAATDVVRQQLCRIAADGRVSPEEATAIREAADAAERAGVPQDIVDAARAVAEAGANAPQEAVDRLRQKCAEGGP
jgi:hypothetical protein